jgi:hypothetical protein
MKITLAVRLALTEYSRAKVRFGAFNSPHEGYAVILEELDELWEEIKRKPTAEGKLALRREAVQVAAMGLRFLVDCCDYEGEE